MNRSGESGGFQYFGRYTGRQPVFAATDSDRDPQEQAKKSTAARRILVVREQARTVLTLIAVLVVCGASVSVIVIVHYSGHPVDTATILAADLADVGLAITILMALAAWWQKGPLRRTATTTTPSQTAAAADRLAMEMTDQWQREASRRRIVTPAPAAVRWRWATEMALRQDVIAPPPPGTGPRRLPSRSKSGEILGSGVVNRLHDELYARLPHGRLILLGGPGAGKTGAMILLMLAALDRRASQTVDEERAKVPVPIWLTLSRWDPSTTTLQEWAVARMNLEHPALRAPGYGSDAARELLRGGRIALFLDGLDEIPEGVRGQALKRINEEVSGLRVVLTSRPEEYQFTAEGSALDNTAVIELRPVRASAAAAYLLRGHAGPRRQQWVQVADYLTCNPDSVAARTLDNPLTLSLARDAYANKNPGEMTDLAVFPTSDALRDHLVDQILISAYPDEHQRERVERWLSWIAGQMGTSRDLAWWDIPTWMSHLQLRLAGVLGIGIIAGLVSVLTLDITPALTSWLGSNSTLGAATGLVNGMGTGLVFGLVFGPWFGRTGKPHTVALRWPGPLGYVPLLASLPLFMIGVVSATLWGSLTGVFGWLAFAFTIGTAALAAIMLRAALSTPAADTPAATPIATYYADRRTSVVTGLMTGLAFGLISGFTATTASTGFLSFLANRFDAAVPVACGVALAAGILTGQVPHLKFTEIILSCRYRNRIRFMQLLEEASDLEVLRQAGATYQFRHAALQERLGGWCFSCVAVRGVR
jgi:hypothetical protein